MVGVECSVVVGEARVVGLVCWVVVVEAGTVVVVATVVEVVEVVVVVPSPSGNCRLEAAGGTSCSPPR